MPSQTPAPVPRQVTVLSKQQLQQLRQRLPKPVPRDGDTPQQVGYLLGIQAALLALEEGFVVP